MTELLASFEKSSLEGMRKVVTDGATAEVIVSTLQDFTKIAQEYDSVFPFASLSEKAEDFVSAILSYAISELFQKCERDAAGMQKTTSVSSFVLFLLILTINIIGLKKNRVHFSLYLLSVFSLFFQLFV